MIEIVFGAIGILGMITSIKQLRNDVITIHQFFFWMIIWICLFGFTFLVQFLNPYIVLIGVKRPLDLFYAVGILILLLSVLKMSIKIESLNREITQIIRIHSIHNVKSASKQKSVNGSKHPLQSSRSSLNSKK